MASNLVMSQGTWTTTQSSRSAPTISYAERLRQAARQKVHGRDKEPASSSHNPVTHSQDLSDKTEPNQLEALHQTELSEKPHTQPATPSRSPSNVWESRLRQRAVQPQKASLTDVSSNIEEKTSSPSCSSSTPDSQQSHKSMKSNLPDNARETVNSDLHHRSPELQESLRSTASSSKEGLLRTLPDNDVWLQRIHMLNGGYPVARYGKLAPSAVQSNNSPNTKSNDQGGMFPSKPVNSAPTYSVPLGVLAPNSDGSFAPVRSSDQHNSTMQAYAQAAGSMQMGYYPYIPNPFHHEFSNEDRNWARRGRDGRGRGRGNGRGRGGAFAAMSAPTHFSPYQPNVMPYMIMPGAPLYVPPNMPFPGAMENENINLTSPVGSRADSQSNASDAEESRSDTGEQSNASTESTSGSSRVSQVRHNQNNLPFHGPHAPPLQGQTPLMPYAYIIPAQSLPGQYDSRFGPMIPVPGFSMSSSGVPPGPNNSNPPTVARQLLSQLEFYFSDANLEIDFFLRQQMDSNGFVSLDTVLSFKRIQHILSSAAQGNMGLDLLDKTRQISLLRSALTQSGVLELDESNSRVRRKHAWDRYVLRPGEG